MRQLALTARGSLTRSKLNYLCIHAPIRDNAETATRGVWIVSDWVTGLRAGTFRGPLRDAVKLARQANVRMLVLTHLTLAGMPGFPDTFIAGIDQGEKLDWRLAQDGMTIDLPVGTTDIRIQER